MNIILRNLFFNFVVLSLLLSACGMKGDPTLRTFEKPSPVMDIKAAHREDEVIISWSYPAKEREKIKGFYIEKASAVPQDESAGKPGFKNIAFLKSDASRFVDEEFETGKEYFYKLRVYSLRNVISDESRVVRVNPLELPQPPSGLAYKVTGEHIEITWEGASGNVRYNIYRSLDKGEYPESPLNNIPLKEPFLQDRIESERISYYAVRALLDTDIKDEGYPSEELEVNPATFVPTSPSSLKYVPSPGKIHLMWKESPETWIKGYRIYRKKITDAGFKLIGESITPAFTDIEPLPTSAFYYATSVGPEKESVPSEPVEVYPSVER